jgi:hypothetical protein
LLLIDFTAQKRPPARVHYAARRHHGRLGALRARAGGDRMRRIGVLLGVAERDLIPLGLADEVIE